MSALMSGISLAFTILDQWKPNHQMIYLDKHATAPEAGRGQRLDLRYKHATAPEAGRGQHLDLRCKHATAPEAGRGQHLDLRYKHATAPEAGRLSVFFVGTILPRQRRIVDLQFE
jgi:hypothetical protein